MGVLQYTQHGVRNEDTEEDRQHTVTGKHTQRADGRIIRDHITVWETP